MILHQSVLLYESIQALDVKPIGVYIDGTFGLGGHSKLILSKLTNAGRLLAMDRDISAVKLGGIIATNDTRFSIIHSAFSKIKKYAQDHKVCGMVDGILLDLGICLSQLNDISRGFSFMNNGLLDMRMDISTGQSAADWLSAASEQEISWVLNFFGEERFSKKIAKAIVKKRKYKSILYSYDLSKIICDVIPYVRRYKHPATRTFLAIRMYINQELDEIQQVLKDALEILSTKGRLVVITFNSLEDRLVKDFIRRNSCIIGLPSKFPLTTIQINRYYEKCLLRNLGKLVPSYQEVERNPCARSAILRYVEKRCI